MTGHFLKRVDAQFPEATQHDLPRLFFSIGRCAAGASQPMSRNATCWSRFWVRATGRSTSARTSVITQCESPSSLVCTVGLSPLNGCRHIRTSLGERENVSVQKCGTSKRRSGASHGQRSLEDSVFFGLAWQLPPRLASARGRFPQHSCVTRRAIRVPGDQAGKNRRARVPGASRDAPVDRARSSIIEQLVERAQLARVGRGRMKSHDGIIDRCLASRAHLWSNRSVDGFANRRREAQRKKAQSNACDSRTMQESVER